MDNKIQKLLYRSFDSELSENEIKILNKALRDSEKLQSQKEEISKMRNTLKQKNSKGFGNTFADKIMYKIRNIDQKSGEELFFDSIISVFRPLAIAATFIIAFLLSYDIISENDNLFNGNQETQIVTLAEAFDPINVLTTE